MNGLHEGDFSATYECDTAASASGNAAIGIGLNSTSSPARSAMTPASQGKHTMCAYDFTAGLGVTELYALEISAAGTATFTASSGAALVIGGAQIAARAIALSPSA